MAFALISTEGQRGMLINIICHRWTESNSRDVSLISYSAIAKGLNTYVNDIIYNTIKYAKSEVFQKPSKATVTLYFFNWLCLDSEGNDTLDLGGVWRSQMLLNLPLDLKRQPL